MEQKRITYVDHMKVFLTLLVIAHHTLQAYTFGGDYAIKDVCRAKWLSNCLCVNMTFFMGAFFFISGYFVPKSLESKTTSQYIKGRAKRLLIPIIWIMFILCPIYSYLGYCYNETGKINFFSYYIQVYLGQWVIEYDHGWYLISLFVYSMLYLLIKKPCEKIKGKLTIQRIVGFTVVMSLLTWCIRWIYPIDQWVDVLWIIGIEPAHLPQYIMWFVAGTLTYRNQWLEQITSSIGRGCTVIGLVMAGLIYCRSLFPVNILGTDNGWFSVYESVMSVSIVISLVYLFKNHLYKQGRVMRSLSQNAFNMYIVHNLFVVIGQVLMSKINVNVYLKFIIATSIAISCSFILAVVITSVTKRLSTKRQLKVNLKAD